MDILFSDKEYIFSHRVGGILIQNGKILLQKPKNDDYAIIGGHVNLFETTGNALRREFKEKLHTEIEIDNLMAIGEVFFPWGKKPCHQISLYYKIHLSDENALSKNEIISGFDCLDNKKITLDFCWIPIKELKNITVYPKEITPIILKNSTGTEHFVSNQLGQNSF